MMHCCDVIILVVVMVTSLMTMSSGSSSGFRCSTERKVNRVYGDGTLYEDVRGEMAAITNRSFPFTSDECRPVHIYHVVRHGSQESPGWVYDQQAELLELMRRVNESGSATQCDEDLEGLGRWEVDEHDSEVERKLTEYGGNEIQNLMIRFYQRFPELYPDGAEPHMFKFSSSKYQRTIESMRITAQYIHSGKGGYVESPGYLRVIPRHRDRFIRFDKTCDKFVRSTPDAGVDFNRFMKGKRMSKLVEDVRVRLGLNELSTTELYEIYQAGCKSHYQLNRSPSCWCKIFSKRQMKSLQFASILEFAKKFRYNPVARDMSCNLARSIVTTLRDAQEETSSGRRYPLASFNFGHKYTIMSLVANMGFYKDAGAQQRLKWKDRKYFQVDQMLPTAANLAFVLYKCDDGHYRVQVLWNEHLQKIESCSNPSMCTLPEFLQLYRHFITGSEEQCRFRHICEETIN